MRIERFIFTVFFVALVSLAGLAQGLSNVKTRELFVTKEADGMEVKVWWQNEKGDFVVVDPNRNFKEGDKIRVQFQGNFDGLVYFLNIAPNGETRVIYKNTLRSGDSNFLPLQPEVIAFDDKPGTEVLRIVMSRQRVDEFETALEKTEGLLNKTPSKAAGETSGGKKAPPKQKQVAEIGATDPTQGQQCAGLELSSGGTKVKCRNLIIGKGDEKKGEGTVFVAATDPRTKQKLQPDEVAVIELIFNHVAAPR